MHFHTLHYAPNLSGSSDHLFDTDVCTVYIEQPSHNTLECPALLLSAPLCPALLLSAPLCPALLLSAPLCPALLLSAPLCPALPRSAQLCAPNVQSELVLPWCHLSSLTDGKSVIIRQTQLFCRVAFFWMNSEHIC